MATTPNLCRSPVSLATVCSLEAGSQPVFGGHERGGWAMVSGLAAKEPNSTACHFAQHLEQALGRSSESTSKETCLPQEVHMNNLFIGSSTSFETTFPSRCLQIRLRHSQRNDRLSNTLEQCFSSHIIARRR